MRTHLLGCVSTLSLLFPAQALHAQSETKPNDLGTVFLTGLKREEQLLTFPGGAAIADEADLNARTVRAISDLEKLFSGVSIDSRGSQVYTNISVRGQASLDFYNPSVQLYVDGVPQDAGSLGQILPFGTESVELLYGPQGTLYGRGAVGGVLNVNSVRPGEGAKYSFGADYGSGLKAVHGKAEAQLGNGIWADFAYSYQDTKGDLKLPARAGDKEVGGWQTRNARFRLRYAPDDSPLDVMFTAQRSNVDSNEEYFVTPSNFDKRIAAPFQSEYEQITDTYALNIAYDLDWGTLTSVTSYQDRDLDRTIFATYTPETQKTKTQEFRLSSDSNETLRYVVGLSFQESDFTRKARGATVNIKTKNTALYGDLTWAVTDRLEVSPGVRFDREESKVRAYGFGRTFHAKNSWGETTGKLGISYAVQDNLQIYGLFSSGFKAGGFSRNALQSAAVLSYDPQRIYNSEVGIKFANADGSLTGSVSAYHTRTKDFQMFVGRAPVQYLQNVGEVTTKGLEAQVSYRPGDWGIKASAGYVEAKFTDYKNPLAPGTNLTGNRVPFVPEVTANLMLDRRFDIGNGASLTPRIGLSYQSRVWFNEQNTVGQSAVTLVDAGVSWEMANGAVLDFYGTNLTDETYAQYGFAFAPENAFTMGRGREFGVRFNMSF